MFSVCSHLGRGLPRPGPDEGGGYPGQVQWGEYPNGVYPTSGTSHQTWPSGYPDGGTPPWVPPVGPGRGLPPISPGQGVPRWGGGTPYQVPMPHQTWPGGYPISYRITDGVLDTPQSVCLLPQEDFLVETQNRQYPKQRYYRPYQKRTCVFKIKGRSQAFLYCGKKNLLYRM